MQDIEGWAWASYMHYSHRRENEVSIVTEPVVAHCWHQYSWANSADWHVSITLSPFSLVSFGFVFCTFDTLSGLFLINASLLPLHHMPSSTSLNFISTMSSIIIMYCVLYFMSRYGVTDLHCSSTNNAGLAHAAELLETSYDSKVVRFGQGKRLSFWTSVKVYTSTMYVSPCNIPSFFASYMLMIT